MGIKRYETAEYTVSYTSMRGVDFSNTENAIKRYRFSHLENMYRDYAGDGEGITESVPGFRRLARLEAKPNGIFLQRLKNGEEYIVIHASSSIFRFPVRELDTFNIARDGMIGYMKLENRKSSAFSNSEGTLFILDGTKITAVCDNGTIITGLDVLEDGPYVPTTYLNGEEYEQRNLLTAYSKEVFDLYGIEKQVLGTEGLVYEIVSLDARTCRVVGIKDGSDNNVHVPYYAKINGERFRVVEVAERAFSGSTSVSEIHLPESCIKLSNEAFATCTSLGRVYFSDSVEEIGDAAFSGCTSLSILYLGKGLLKIGTGAFKNCSNLKGASFAGTSEEFLDIIGKDELDGVQMQYSHSYPLIDLEIPIFGRVHSVNGATVGSTAFTVEKRFSGITVASAIIRKVDRELYAGKRLELACETADLPLEASDGEKDFAALYGLSGKEALAGCTLAESFDGKIFLSGNPKIPNAVFYTANDSSGRANALYFGAYNYFFVGEESTRIDSMLGTGDSLIIFTSGGRDMGGIYYHTPKETGIDIIPKIYPATYVHKGVMSFCKPICFFGEPTILCSEGVVGLEKKTTNLERGLGIRSHNVNAKLLSENLSSATMTRWQGYLVICTGERFYLADPRQVFTHPTGNVEYEWYYLSGIGTYSETSPTYNYSSTPTEGVMLYPDVREPITGTLAYQVLGDGRHALVAKDNTGTYLIEKTPEKVPVSELSPAALAASFDGERLFFICQNGDLCVFNNDKRGIAPDHVKNHEDFDEAEYKKRYGKSIHPDFYSFEGIAPKYVLKTASDDCGIPHLEKSTVKGSLAIKLKLFGTGEVTLEARTERRGYKEIAKLPNTCFDFERLDFSAFSFEGNEYIILPIAEKEKGWVEKELTLSSKKAFKPFGFVSLAYRVKMKGKIKLK